MTDTSVAIKPKDEGKSGLSAMLSMLWRDKLAFVSAIILVFIVLCALLGPALLGDLASSQNLRGRNFAPFSFERGWAFVLGGDSLGRPMLARLVVAARSTILVASGAVAVALVVGATLGLIAGYMGKGVSQAIMRLADVIMSFPSLLIAVVVLYVLGPSIPNMILVLAITRIPIYLRTTRAEVLEVRERMFVQAAVVMGASHRRIIARHILPVVVPTLVTIATLDFAFVMLAESSLSFLGIGIQPPDITWPDGRPGPALPHHRLVAGTVAGPVHRHHHPGPQSSVQLDARCPRPRPALASRSPEHPR